LIETEPGFIKPLEKEIMSNLLSIIKNNNIDIDSGGQLAIEGLVSYAERRPKLIKKD